MADGLKFSVPDFDNIKESLKTYLKNQKELKDYDFDGSMLSTILDTLSYNTNMNTFYLNMVANEAFLTTAHRRESIINGAANLGYVPFSTKAARTSLYVEYDGDGSTPTIVIPKGSMFNAAMDYETFIFTTTKTNIAIYNPVIDKFVVDDVEVVEGIPTENIFTVVPIKNDTNIFNVGDVILEGCNLPNDNVDADLIEVFVKDPTVTSDFIEYTKYDGLLNLDENSRVFFVAMNELGNLSIRFGNGSLGMKPAPGSQIQIKYIITSGADANGIALFNQVSAVDGGIATNIVPITPSFGGADSETNDSIKFNAPRAYESQNRGVVGSDFEYLVKQIYPSARDVRVWGGEDNVPPQYGKVFIMIIPEGNKERLTNFEKELIIDALKKNSLLTTIPVIVDSEYVYITINSKVLYNNKLTHLTTSEFEQKIANDLMVKLSNDTNYSKSVFLSKLMSSIDSLDRAIISNLSSIELSKRMYIPHNGAISINESFSNMVKPETLTSTIFTYNGFTNCSFSAKDDGTIIIENVLAGVKSIVNNNAGTISKDTGVIVINNIVISNSTDVYFDENMQSHYIKLTIEPDEENVYTASNQILSIENINIVGVD